MRPGWRRHRPPWWPENEPWPPRHGPFGSRRWGRSGFFHRGAFGMVIAMTLVMIATGFVARTVAGQFGFGRAAIPLAGLVVVFGAVAAIQVTFAVMRRFGSPLAEVMEAADRVAGGDYTTRVKEYGPPQMRGLLRSFNAMTARLEHADRMRRDFMADIAHELRTPLSVLQGQLEGLADGVYTPDDRRIGELLDETRVLSRLVEDLRTLALSDAGALPLQKESVDVAALAADVVRSLQPEAARKNVTLASTRNGTDTMADVDPLRIREVLTNLISNA